MTKAISPKVIDQLAKLIPCLASSFDGERLATLAAIERVLAAEKLDLHDVVAALTRSTQEKEYDEDEYEEEEDDPPPGWFKLPANYILTLVNRIQRSPRLSANAHEFVNQMRD